MFKVYMTLNLNSFSKFEQYLFCASIWKSLKNNAPPTILSSSAPWYFLQYHQRYSIQYTTQVTHTFTPTTLPKLIPARVNRADASPILARQPRNPRQHTTHASTCYSHKHVTHSNYASTPPMQVQHPRLLRQHTIHASTSPTRPTLAQIERYFSNSY